MGIIIGITGGIGSGKSVVSRLLRLTGEKVVDCDMEARWLMESDRAMKCAIRDEISAEVTDGESVPDRKALARLVFAEEALRLKLNAIVHGAVRSRVQELAAGEERIWVEAALLFESGLADMCHKVILVEAPEEMRLGRICRRDDADIAQARARIESQAREAQLGKEWCRKHPGRYARIENSGRESLLVRVDELGTRYEL